MNDIEKVQFDLLMILLDNGIIDDAHMISEREHVNTLEDVAMDMIEEYKSLVNGVTTSQKTALNLDGVKYCALETLNIGDKVQIRHAHKYENGYWQCWCNVDYKYLGFKGGEYHFQNLKDEHEHFRMKSEYEDMHVFVGKHCT